MVVALQRLEAWGDRSSSPRGGPNALSWGSAALQGLASRRFRADIGSARPVRRFHALRVITGLDVRTAEAARGPSCAFAPLQRSIAAGPHRAVGLSASVAMPPLMGFHALRHDLGAKSSVRCGVASRRRPAPRPGFGYPLRGVHRRPYRRTRRRSALGLRPSRLRSRRPRPSRGPCRPDVLARHPSLAGGAPASAFTALLSSRALDPRPRGLESSSFLGLSPSEPSPPPSGPSLVVARPALPPLRGVTFRPAWVTGPYEAKGSADPSPDCRLPWGFAPSDRRGAPFAVPGSGLMDSPRGADRLRDRLPL